jgi:natural product precursor
MKKLGKLNLQEMKQQMLSVKEFELSQLLGGSCDTRVEITVSRFGLGSDSTVSTFTATAVDMDGTPLGADVTGYFLEPGWDGGSNGADTAIPTGGYGVVQSTFNGNPGYYEVANVPDRTEIKIHTGNYHTDTTGCLLPGTSYGQDASGNYYVNQSDDKRIELTNLLDTYGSDGCVEITIA